MPNLDSVSSITDEDLGNNGHFDWLTDEMLAELASDDEERILMSRVPDKPEATPEKRFEEGQNGKIQRRPDHYSGSRDGEYESARMAAESRERLHKKTTDENLFTIAEVKDLENSDGVDEKVDPNDEAEWRDYLSDTPVEEAGDNGHGGKYENPDEALDLEKERRQAEIERNFSRTGGRGNIRPVIHDPHNIRHWR